MKVGSDKNELLQRIKIRQRIMYNKAQSFGLTHPSVVAHSQKLDVLINKYQGI